MKAPIQRGRMHTSTILTGVAAGLQIVFTLVSILGLFGLNLFVPVPGLSLVVGFIGFSSVVLGVVWSFIDYGVIYLEMRKGRFLTISSAMLVIGVLQLAFGATVSGVLILLAWAIEQK